MFESVQSLPTVPCESAWRTIPTIGPIETMQNSTSTA